MPTAAERIAELTANLAVFKGTDAGRTVDVLNVTFIPDAEAPAGYRARVEAVAKTGGGAPVVQACEEFPTPAGWRAQLDSLFGQARTAWRNAQGVP